MKRWRPAFLVVAAALLAGISLVLARAGSEQRAMLASTQARLTELRTQRLHPRDMDQMKGALAAGPDPQAGLLIAPDAEASAQLEAIFRSVAQDHKAQIQSISLMADSTNPKLPVVRGKMHLVIRGEHIRSFVKSLETGSPAIFLERVRIAYRPSIETENEASMLDLTTSIVVYRHSPAAEAARP